MLTPTVCAEFGCPDMAARCGRCETHAKAERRRRHETTRAWGRLRQKVLVRADGRCERCGGVATDAHHVVARVDGGRDSLANLVALCSDCHQQEHRRRCPNPRHAKGS
ncbi:MAG: HNH endonuclease [Solirubrobacteraceae bacterium]